MKRFINIAATTLTDQAGLPKLVVLGLAGDGTVWIKDGHLPWRRFEDKIDAQKSA